MTHSSASKSNAHCSSGNTASQRPCGAAKSCPVSDEFAAKPDTFCEEVSRHTAFPGVVFDCGYIPKARWREHRRTPASAERHMVLCTSHAGVQVCDTSTDRHGDELPAARTRRKQLSGRLSQDSLHICESVFFRPKVRIVAFFPRFCASQPDFTTSQNLPKRLQTDGYDNLFLDEIFTQLCQRPSSKGFSQQVRRTQGRLDNNAFLLLAEFFGSPDSILWFEGGNAFFVELPDDAANVLDREVKPFSNSWHFKTLCRREDDLCSANFDAVFASSKDLLQVSAFIKSKLPDVQTHKQPPCKKRTKLFDCVCLYNIELAMAQVYYLQNVTLPFWKRH
jgi:hypothetical protein